MPVQHTGFGRPAKLVEATQGQLRDHRVLRSSTENSEELGFSPSMGNNFPSYTNDGTRGSGRSHYNTIRRETMPANESNKENVSDVVSGFSIAFVGLCRALEQQHKVRPDSIVQSINLEMEEMPSGPIPAEVKTIVTKITNAVSGKPIEVRMAQSTR